jgi:hypothetical protein
LVVFCAISFRFQQPSSFDTNAKIKAVFIYNFTRYFEWSETKKTGDFIVYVVGKNDNLISELKNLAAKKKVGSQNIEIKNTPTFDPSINSNIVYLTPDISKTVVDVISKNKNKGTLMVAEGLNACKAGASINFVVIDNKLKFEYSKNNAVKSGLKTNDDFVTLAINID